MRVYISRLAASVCACIVSLPVHAAPLHWFVGDRLSGQALAVMQELNEADRQGLDSDNYRLSVSQQELEQLKSGKASATLRLSFDAQLSNTVALFLRHLEFGQVLARDAGFFLPAPQLPEPMAAVAALASSVDVEKTIALHEPRPRPYALLARALVRYRDLARKHPAIDLPAFTRSLRLGDDYAGASELRELLQDLGDYVASADAPGGPRIDAALVAAISSFQHRHGLEDDGVIGQQTYAALSVPLSRRVRQIELTMERWRWAGVLGRPDIVVNVPQFMVYLLPRPGGPNPSALEMPIIVGQSLPGKRTPMFSADLKYVIFQPYWDIPMSIVRRELLPLIRKDPGYLERHHMELVNGQSDSSPVVAVSPAAIEDLAAGRLRLRQRPGADNALGPVKFMLPNPYNVYLHGTPAVRLFERTQRDFSHGCIRVSQPAVLAEFVLRNAPGDWTAAAIEAAMCGTRTQRVNLTTSLKVLVFYGTAAATQTAGVLFFPDIYGYDAGLEQLLDSRRAANSHR